MHIRVGSRHGTHWQVTWRASRVAKRIVTWRAGNSPRGDMSKGHVSICFRWHVIFQFYHVSFLDSTTCHSLGDPRVVSFLSMCRVPIGPRVTFELLHVAFYGCSTCRFPVVPHVIFIQLHVVLSSQNHFVIELFSGLVLAGASLIFIIPFQPSQLFQHSRPNGQHSSQKK